MKILFFSSLSIFLFSSCAKKSEPYTTEVELRSACVFNKVGTIIGECKPHLDYTFSDLTEQVYRIEIGYEYKYSHIGTGDAPSIGCWLHIPGSSSKISPSSGCPQKTTGSMWAVYENPTGFIAGSYMATFEHEKGSNNPIIRIGYKQ